MARGHRKINWVRHKSGMIQRWPHYVTPATPKITISGCRTRRGGKSGLCEARFVELEGARERTDLGLAEAGRFRRLDLDADRELDSLLP